MEVKWKHLHTNALPPLYLHLKNLVISRVLEVMEVMEVKTPYSRGMHKGGEFSMNAGQIIGHLESMGYTFSLAIDYENDTTPTPEAEELLHRLAADKESAIDYLLSRRYVPLPENTPLPTQWHNQRHKRIFRQAYGALEKHSGASTAAEFKAASDEFIEMSKGDSLLQEVLAAIYSEIARESRKGKAT